MRLLSNISRDRNFSRYPWPPSCRLIQISTSILRTAEAEIIVRAIAGAARDIGIVRGAHDPGEELRHFRSGDPPRCGRANVITRSADATKSPFTKS